jgi:hypothetical protein
MRLLACKDDTAGARRHLELVLSGKLLEASAAARKGKYIMQVRLCLFPFSTAFMSPCFPVWSGTRADDTIEHAGDAYARVAREPRPGRGP